MSNLDDVRHLGFKRKSTLTIPDLRGPIMHNRAMRGWVIDRWFIKFSQQVLRGGKSKRYSSERRGVDRTSSNLRMTYMCRTIVDAHKRILWYRYVPSFRNDGDAKGRGVKIGVEFCTFWIPAKILGSDRRDLWVNESSSAYMAYGLTSGIIWWAAGKNPVETRKKDTGKTYIIHSAYGREDKSAT